MAGLDWLVVQALSGRPQPDNWELSLGKWEREAIQLCLQIGATRLLVDDKAARRAARNLRIPIVGTLGLLLAAKRRRFVAPVRPHLDALGNASFHMTPELYRRLLEEAGEDFA